VPALAVPAAATWRQALEQLPVLTLLLAAPEAVDLPLAPGELEAAAQLLWGRYCEEARKDAARQSEHRQEAVALRGKTMR
jgi:hypothetical protein